VSKRVQKIPTCHISPSSNKMPCVSSLYAKNPLQLGAPGPLFILRVLVLDKIGHQSPALFQCPRIAVRRQPLGSGKERERERSPDSILGKACGRSNVLLMGRTRGPIFPPYLSVCPSGSLKPPWGLTALDDQSFCVHPWVSQKLITMVGGKFFYGTTPVSNHL